MLEERKENKDYVITVQPLTGLDTKTFNATINAFRAGRYVAFSANYAEDFQDFFVKSYIEEDGKAKELSFVWEHFSITKLSNIFEEVLKLRKEEFSNSILAEKEVKFEDLDRIEQMKYSLIYKYGDKLGGYLGVASINLDELLRVNKLFNDIEDAQRKALNKKE
ncbi:MAG: hypothetical protein LBQ34_06700 [Alphaproteobacteria bacterium]|jgi:hypothetical protein|nr:hypothetical protein [Alphaproteobacteria bacterium]